VVLVVVDGIESVKPGGQGRDVDGITSVRAGGFQLLEAAGSIFVRHFFFSIGRQSKQATHSKCSSPPGSSVCIGQWVILLTGWFVLALSS